MKRVCAVCNTGKYPRWSIGGNLCDKHDVCITCRIKRADLDEIPLGSSDGSFQCKPCEAADRQERIEERKSKGFDHDSTDDITCPHCGYQYGDSWEYGNADGSEEECPDCHQKFNLKVDVSRTFTTTKKS